MRNTEKKGFDGGRKDVERRRRKPSYTLFGGVMNSTVLRSSRGNILYRRYLFTQTIIQCGWRQVKVHKRISDKKERK
jgi:hypothetical protein